MTTLSKSILGAIAIVLAIAACDVEPSEPSGEELRGVEVAVGDLVATSQETPDGIVTELRAAGSDELVATFEWDAESNEAGLTVEAHQTTYDVTVEEEATPTLDNAHEHAIRMYELVTSGFRMWGYELCCWNGDLSYCGFEWEAAHGPTICCGWCYEHEQE